MNNNAIKLIDLWQLPRKEVFQSSVVDDKSLEILMRIEQVMQRLAVIGDDEQRSLWIEVLRGAPEEWREYEEVKENEEVSSYEEYLSYWQEMLPNEVEWWRITSARYKKFHYLIISDGERHLYTLSSTKDVYSERPTAGMVDVAETLAKIETYVTSLVDDIVTDANSYNKYVAKNLPYGKRTGRIRRSILNNTLPEYRMKIEDKTRAVAMLEQMVASAPKFIEHMTLRDYMHYWRIADTAFYKCENRFKSSYDSTQPQTDEEYFRRSGKGYEINKYDLDSESVFRKWIDEVSIYHGLDIAYARISLFPEYKSERWCLHMSTWRYYYMADVIRIALALADNNVPVFVYQAQTMLDIIAEKDYVGLTPYGGSHLKIGEVGNDIWLPEADEDISEQSVQSIIDNAEWDPIEEVKPL